MKLISLKDLPTIITSHNVGKKKEIIKNGEIESLTQFSQVTFMPGEVVKEHNHEDLYEVYLVEEGEGTLRLNGQKYHIEKGICFVVEPGELHEVENTSNGELVLTYFVIQKQKRI